jgi:hypothetical protein
VQVAAVSHTARFDRRANLTRAVEAAMNESVDQEAPVLYPPAEDLAPRVTRAHEALVEISGSPRVASFPIVVGERVVGAATLEHADEQGLTPSDRELVGAALSFVGPLLDAERREDRWIGAKALDALREQLAKVFGPSHVAAKLSATTVLLLVLFLALAKGDFRVSADTVLEARILRAATAPFAGYLAEAPARAGDLVAEGDLLARVDDRELLLEQARHGSELAQLREQYRQAMSERDAPQVEILSARIEQVSAQVDLVSDQLERTRIVAPFDGIVVSGDLSQRIGAPMERGELLFDVAPLDSYRVVLLVEERDIDEIALGQHGSVAFFAFPQDRFELEVEKITPVSEAGEGQNRFRVEARLTGDSSPLRPGLEGVAKVEVDQRRLLWIWTREAIDWVRLGLWRWLP